MLSRCPQLLSLPSKILPYKGSHLRPRNFHSSPSPHNALVDLSYQIFQNVHSFTGTSWAVSIPLTAFVFRASFWPAQYVLLRRRMRRQALVPLQAATEKVLVKHANATRMNTPQGAKNPSRWETGARWSREAVRRDTQNKANYKIPHALQSVLLPLAFLPIWFVNIGVVLAMTGVERTSALKVLFDSATLPPPEPAFASEGFLWITTLSHPDPYILPATAGALLYLSIYGFQVQNFSKDYMVALRRHRFYRTSKTLVPVLWVQFLEMAQVVALAMAVVLSSAPAALPLYMCGSTSAQMLGTSILQMIVGQRSVRRPAAQTHKLKHQFKHKHSMDVFRPPQKL